MVVIWSSLAEEQLNAELDYYEENANPQVALKILDMLKVATDRLATFPLLGFLIEENPLYRVLIEGHYKIVYSVEEDQIRIAFLFNTWQDPSRLMDFLGK